VDNAEDKEEGEREGEEDEQWLAVKTADAGGQRELLSTVHYSLLCFCSFSCGLCL
jgi:hypothetical protein